MIINPNDEIKKFKKTEDKVSDKITGFAGSMQFVYIHSIWFTVWILINVGVFGVAIIFDDFPFGLLTLIVSLEAIFLSTFVMISQNRQAKASDIRSELDYHVNVKAEKEINILLQALHRIADKQGIDMKDLLEEYDKTQVMPEIKKSKHKNS
ncbi:MAG TPA: DUF1003 domain-containing protein [Candidatus Saccharimonadales bacterium]|nr:DUF1003 domain-containing protein [Candidatus Saccharimonadales bacterium]